MFMCTSRVARRASHVARRRRAGALRLRVVRVLTLTLTGVYSNIYTDLIALSEFYTIKVLLYQLFRVHNIRLYCQQLRATCDVATEEKSPDEFLCDRYLIKYQHENLVLRAKLAEISNFKFISRYGLVDPTFCNLTMKLYTYLTSEFTNSLLDDVYITYNIFIVCDYYLNYICDKVDIRVIGWCFMLRNVTK